MDINKYKYNYRCIFDNSSTVLCTLETELQHWFTGIVIKREKKRFFYSWNSSEFVFLAQEDLKDVVLVLIHFLLEFFIA